MGKALGELGSTVPDTVADIGALAIHLRMVLATSEYFEGDFAPLKEGFAALAGKGALVAP